jgi:hypothetical protein
LLASYRLGDEMLTKRRTSQPRREQPPRPRLREIRLALRQLDVYVARMTDPTDEHLLAAAAATLFATPPTRSAA